MRLRNLINTNHFQQLFVLQLVRQVSTGGVKRTQTLANLVERFNSVLSD